jgi:hypothetical protein
MPHENITDDVKIALDLSGGFRSLTSGEKSLADGMVMPSSEAVFRDFNQPGLFNARYPSPSDGVVSSGLLYPDGSIAGPSGVPMGIYPTYPSGVLASGAGFIKPNGLDTTFSNSKETKDLLDRAGITDFTIFNNYIHYYGRG